MALIRALRDGTDPVATARHALEAQAGKWAIGNFSNREIPMAKAQRVPYITRRTLKDEWFALYHNLAQETLVEEDRSMEERECALWDACALMAHQGDLFTSGQLLYINPPFVTQLIKPLVDHRLAFGLKWDEAGSEKPDTGTELANEKLADALKSTNEFSPAEWAEFEIQGLNISHFIKLGNKYFKPVGLAENLDFIDHFLNTYGTANAEIEAFVRRSRDQVVTALQALVTKGELRELLLPLLWAHTG